MTERQYEAHQHLDSLYYPWLRCEQPDGSTAMVMFPSARTSYEAALAEAKRLDEERNRK